MYDELKKSLRELCEMTALCNDYSCFACPYEEKCSSYKNGRLSAVYRQAADAIEQLGMRLHGDEAAIAGMKREIERMVVADKPRWIPVNEAFPEAGERVLCYCRANIYEVMKMRTNGDWVYDTNHVYMHSFVTHWMPIPKAQEEERV